MAWHKTRTIIRREERGPLRVLFLTTSMPVGGAETLLVDLLLRLNRERFSPRLCCLKERGVLGDRLADEIPVHAQMLAGKYDFRVLPRLVRLLRRDAIDAVVTVGAGDKMFWGRLAAWIARVPVIASALHSTGWPDGVGRWNRMLTFLTDAFIAVADQHGQFLVQQEGFPNDKVTVIPNGVDTDRFQRCERNRTRLRESLALPRGAPVCGIVAALRPEKNHALFLKVASRVHQNLPAAQFLIAGDGPPRPELETLAGELGLTDHVHFLGTRSDIPEVLSACDVFALTSDNEANPVSILEAMSMELPVVATDVGSVSETVNHGITGYLARPGDEEQLASYCSQLLGDARLAAQFGREGRQSVVAGWSVHSMVAGYEALIDEIYDGKSRRSRQRAAIQSHVTAVKTAVSR